VRKKHGSNDPLLNAIGWGKKDNDRKTADSTPYFLFHRGVRRPDGMA